MNESKEKTKRDLIFIIEDNNMYSMMIEYLLSESNRFRFVQFSSGEECIANLNQNPQAIILDYFLPGMNGYDTFRKIKEKRPNIPVIVLSENRDKKAITQFFAEGVYEYILKEQDSIEELKSILHKIIDDKNEKNRKLNLRKRKLLPIASTLMLVLLIILALLNSILIK